MSRDAQEVYNDLEDMEQRLTDMLDHPEVEGFEAEDRIQNAIGQIVCAKLDLPVPEDYE